MEDLFCKEKITYNWKGFKINWFFFYGFQKEIYIQLVGCAYPRHLPPLLCNLISLVIFFNDFQTNINSTCRGYMKLLLFSQTT
jgi:hypothetical protein